MYWQNHASGSAISEDLHNCDEDPLKAINRPHIFEPGCEKTCLWGFRHQSPQLHRLARRLKFHM